MYKPIGRSMAAVLTLAGSCILVSDGGAAEAQSTTPSPVLIQGGERLYKEICQACHMQDAKGAVGAGSYPALAANPKLAGKAYPLFIVINGFKAMPSFGELLSDRQIADVVNYTRTHFGNHYTDRVSLDEVKMLRPATSSASKE